MEDNKSETRGPGEQILETDKVIRDPFGNRDARLFLKNNSKNVAGDRLKGFSCMSLRAADYFVLFLL